MKGLFAQLPFEALSCGETLELDTTEPTVIALLTVQAICE